MRWPWTTDPAAERRKAERDLVYWAGVVGEIERGYELTIYDYTNDLDIHAALRERVGRLPSRDPLHRQLATLDERFEAATRAIDVATTRGTEQIRVPLNARGELLADLRSRGWT